MLVLQCLLGFPHHNRYVRLKTNESEFSALHLILKKPLGEVKIQRSKQQQQLDPRSELKQP